MRAAFLRLFLLGLVCCIAGCGRSDSRATGPLPQRTYLWQRDWTPAVRDALGEIEQRTDGVVVLGAEIVWNESKPEARQPSIDWEALARARMSRSLAVRIAPWAGPFAENDARADFIAATVQSLADEAKAHGVALDEIQIDFDCAQKKLDGYRLWLRRLRAVVRPPIRLVITTLPAWLSEPEFDSLVQEVDGYVLQVHSVPTRQESGRAELFDPALAKKWVALAAKRRRPFSVALPTYRAVAGYDEAGKLLGVYLDGVAPKWPPGTARIELAADAEAIADLVRSWQTARPPELRELLWYRAPVASDARNWRWPTLAAVMAGRRPRHELQLVQEGGNPVDLSLFNAGEAEESLGSVIIARWESGQCEAADALSGWSVVVEEGRARFIPTIPPVMQLPPGARRSIGWLRFAQPTTVELRVED